MTPFVELMLGVAMSVLETALLGVHSVDRRRAESSQMLSQHDRDHVVLESNPRKRWTLFAEPIVR
jgi:heme exporter protein D